MKASIHTQKIIFYFILFLCYFFYSLRAQLKILSGKHVKQSKVLMHSILTWGIPFLYWLWSYDTILGKPVVMTKAYRKEIRRKNKKWNESGVGYPGAF